MIHDIYHKDVNIEDLKNKKYLGWYTIINQNLKRPYYDHVCKLIAWEDVVMFGKKVGWTYQWESINGPNPGEKFVFCYIITKNSKSILALYSPKHLAYLLLKHEEDLEEAREFMREMNQTF